MAVQDDLAAALSAIALATTALNSVGAQATGAIDKVAAAYKSRIDSLTLGLFVNQITGSDTNPGTNLAPLKTINAAIAKCPVGGYLNIVLQSDYTSGADMVIRNKFITIFGDGVARRLAFAQGIDASTTPNGRFMYGFRFSGNCALVINGLTLVMPELGGFSSYAPNGGDAMFSPVTGADTGNQHITINATRLDFPATQFGPMLAGGWCVGLQLSFCPLVGAATSLNGRVVRDVTNTAGTSVASVPQLLTNLTTV